MNGTRDIKKEIDEAIENQSEIVFIFYSLLEETDERIRHTLEKILEKCGKAEWFTPIFSSIKELSANALKANAKWVLMDEGIINKTDGPIEIVTKLRAILNEKAVLEYGIKTKKRNISSRIYFKLEPDKLIIQVINNLPVAAKDLKKIHERIEISSKYDSIAEFYMDYPDPAAEGMGLGLCMVVTLLKSINVDYRNFTVVTDDKEKTYAKMVIPLV